MTYSSAPTAKLSLTTLTIAGVVSSLLLIGLNSRADLPPVQSAPTESWSYTDCVNQDGVTALPDKSDLWVQYGKGKGAHRSVQIKWNTALFSGYDVELDQATGKLGQDKTPVSASWQFLVTSGHEQGDVKPIQTWNSIEYPLVGDPGQFGPIPALVSYAEEGGTRAIRTEQLFGSSDSKGTRKYWLTTYKSNEMWREEISIDNRTGKITSTIARACGDGPQEKIKQGTQTLKKLPARVISVANAFDVAPMPTPAGE